VALVALALGGALAPGAPEGLPVLGSLGDEERRPPELVLVTRGQEPVRSPVYRTALDVIASRIETDELVSEVRQGPVGRDRRTTMLLVGFERGADAAEREQAAEAVVEVIDPGPLKVLATGLAPTAEEARDSARSDLGQLELLAAPLVVLVLLAAGGWRLALVGALAAAMGMLGATAGLRVLGEVIDLSAVGIAAGAGAALVFGVEAALTIQARAGGAVARESPYALARGMMRSAGVLLPAAAAAMLAALAIIAVAVPVARSAAAGAALGGGLATIATILVAPALLALGRGDREADHVAVQEGRRRRRLSRAFLRRWPVATGLLVLAVAALVAIAVPFANSDPAALGPGGLPTESDPARAFALAEEEFRGERASSALRPNAPDDLLARLAVAAGIAAAVVAAACFAVARSPAAAVVLGAVSVLPAAAALGLLELVFGAGRLTGTLDYSPEGEPNASAAIVTATVLTAVAALRSVRAAPLLRRTGQSRGRPARLRRVRRLARLEIGAAAAASVVGAFAFGVLAGSELLPAKELGLAVAAGLLIDLLLVRCLAVPALARLAP
jgi:hypothetical protein